jgi:hypothetical protein
MLKRSFLAVAVGVFALIGVQQASAEVHVNGYYNSHGTYVPEHYRSNPDGNYNNNWSTSPNVNPHTGEVGRNAPIFSPRITDPSQDYGGSQW